MSVREAIVGVDLDAFADALAPDVVWVGLWPGELCRNRDDVLEMFVRMRERAQELRPRPSIVLDKDDCLVVDPDLDGRHHVIVLGRRGLRGSGLSGSGCRARGGRREAMVRIGRISYVNMAPVFYRVDAEVEEVQGVPTELNRMLVAGELDTAPISSIEYARHADTLRLLPRLCVASEGAVDSIQLVSRSRSSRCASSR